MRFTARVLVSSALVAWCLPASAVVEGRGASQASSAGPPAPPVEELVASALDRSSEMAVLRARLQAARELILPAGALPNPTTSITYAEADVPRFGVGREPMSAVTFEFRQGLPYRGKREARREAARAAVEAVAREVEELRRAVAREVRTIYARVYALDRERAIQASARELLDLLAATASARYSVGDALQEPVIKVQLALSKLDERLDDLAAERRLQVAALNRLLDQPADSSLGVVESLPAVSLPADDWLERAHASAPALATAEARIDAAEARLAVAKLDLKPDFSLTGAIGVRGTLPPVVTFGVSVEWPWWKNEKQGPLVRAAEQEVRLARDAQHDALVTLRTEVMRLTVEWERAQQQIRRYREAILPQTASAMDAARVAYLNGLGDFSTVIEDFGLWLDARVRLAVREADAFAAWADLQALIGSSLANGPGKEH